MELNISLSDIIKQENNITLDKPVKIEKEKTGRQLSKEEKDIINMLHRECDFVTSFSKADFDCKQYYKLNYIDKAKGSKNGIYGYIGGVCHDINEAIYKGEMTKEEGLEEFKSKFLNAHMLGMVFPTPKSKLQYEQDLISFYTNFKVPESVLNKDNELITEEFVWLMLPYKNGTKIGVYGYFDLYQNVNGVNYVGDFKTSNKSDFIRGKIPNRADRIKKGRQLILYAEMINNTFNKNGKFNKFEEFELFWNMLKYCDITVKEDIPLKKFKVAELKEMAEKYNIEVKKKDDLILALKNVGHMEFKEVKYEAVERLDMVGKILNSLSFLINLYDLDTSEFEKSGDLDDLPEILKEYVKVEDCLIYYDYTTENRRDLFRWLLDVYERVEDMRINNDYEPKKEIDFFCQHLCSQNINCYKYQEIQRQFKEQLKKQMNL